MHPVAKLTLALALAAAAAGTALGQPSGWGGGRSAGFLGGGGRGGPTGAMGACREKSDKGSAKTFSASRSILAAMAVATRRGESAQGGRLNGSACRPSSGKAFVATCATTTATSIAGVADGLRG